MRVVILPKAESFVVLSQPTFEKGCGGEDVYSLFHAEWVWVLGYGMQKVRRN